MLVWILEAMNSSTSGGAVSRSIAAFLRRIAIGSPGRGLHVGDQAPLEPAAQPVLEGLEALGRAVGGEHDLLVGVVQGVEGVEELLLRLGLALEELDVVDEQHVDLAVAPLERLRGAGRLIALMNSLVNSSLET